MTSAFVAGAIQSGGTSSLVLAYNPPVGVQAGDLVYALIGIDSAGVVTTPTGWTLDSSAVYGSLSVLTYRRVAVASEPSTAFLQTTAVDAIGTWFAYRAAGGEEAAASQGATSSTTAVSPSVSPTAAGLLIGAYLARIAGGAGTTNLSTPAGMTSRNTSAGPLTLRLADQAVTAGSTGTRTATVSTGVAGDTFGWSILLRDDPPGGWLIGAIGIG